MSTAIRSFVRRPFQIATTNWSWLKLDYSVRKATPKPVHTVGDYKACYSNPTKEEWDSVDSELDELFAQSEVVSENADS
jgi:hypothetical protein